MKTQHIQRGFSLVELMVASALGLLVALAVVTGIVGSGRQFTVISSSSAAQNSAQIALSLIHTAGRSAGSGFFAANQPICPTWNAWNGTAMVSNGGVFLPARIVDGGSATASDRLVFTGAAGSAALTGVPVMVNSTSTLFAVGNVGQFAVGDYAVVGAPGAGMPCTLFQVTALPGATATCGGNASMCQQLTRTAGTGLNPPAATPFTTNPTYGFTSGGGVSGPAIVSRVGSATAGFRQDAFAVQCESLVRYNAFVTTGTPPACTSSPLSFGAGVDAVSADVVQMHVQYGITASAASDTIAEWRNATDDTAAGGSNWAAPSASLAARIKAVRVVVVARAKEPEATAVSNTCTNGGAVVNYGPCAFDDASSPQIDLRSVPTPAGRTWQNYRYRAHTTVVPLRTVIWSD